MASMASARGKTAGLLIGVAMVTALAACDDTTGLDGAQTNEEVEIEIFPVNGTPQTAPTGILIRGPSATRVDLRFNFDIAFDLTPDGQVIVYTARALSSELVGVHRVGLQFDTTRYSDLARARSGGFVYDSLLTVPINETVVIDKLDSDCGGFGTGPFLGFNIKAKMVIDSVVMSRRAIYLHILSNPNCGFLSLAPGRPRD
jgi:hypothetical protein